MDVKCEILDNVTTAVTGIITGQRWKKDGSAEGLLRKFLATKRIEGKSENTIRYYKGSR